MKSVIFLFFISLITLSHSQNKHNDTALIIIDIQEFYFPGGDAELVNPETAADNAALLVDFFRKTNKTVIHVRHNYEPGGSIHPKVKPISDEKVISKDEVNCFKNTDLLHYLNKKKIGTVIICGMQTHMCVEAGVRAAHDYDFQTILIHDACATKALQFENTVISASDVHYSTLSALKSYSRITDTKTFIKQSN